mgnify:CR=1 FL=1
MISLLTTTTIVSITALEAFTEGVAISVVCYAISKGAKNAINFKK